MARHTVRELIKTGEFIIAPGVFDMISAKIADASAAKLLYLTGYGTVASHLGLPDAGIATYSDMVSRVERMANGVSKPLIADGDTGYGGLLNVHHTVRGYQRSGAAGIQLEDQEFPKKCGHTPNRRVVTTDTMVRKIQVAADARASADFVIVARAGADILFIESPENEEELAHIGRAFDVPVLANMVHGGRTPVLAAKRLQALGFRIGIYPVVGFLAMAEALRCAYDSIAAGEAQPPVPLYDFSAFNDLIGFPQIWAFEQRYVET